MRTSKNNTLTDKECNELESCTTSELVSIKNIFSFQLHPKSIFIGDRVRSAFILDFVETLLETRGDK